MGVYFEKLNGPYAIEVLDFSFASPKPNFSPSFLTNFIAVKS